MRGAVRVFLALTLLTVAVVATGRQEWPWRQLPVAPPIVVLPFARTADTLRRGETVSALFARQGVRDLDLAALTGASALRFDPRRLKAGLVFSFRRLPDAEVPTEVEVRPDAERRIRFIRAATGWEARILPIVWRTEVVRIEGTIDNSLYEALNGGVDDTLLGSGERVQLAWDLADIFAWQADFSRDIQPGDRFQVVVERKVSEEGEVRFSRVLAADLSLGGKPLTAFAFGEGSRSFFDAAGESLRRAFLMAPVQFRRISSTFSSARFHPILGRFRRHEGTDYAATPGTPVQAAGDGVVERAGWTGGYGRLIEIRHRNGITTRYGHLQGFAAGITAGTHVSQGEVIGYVGSSGLATGPHLHYEFRVNGVARDSRQIDLGGGTPIDPADRAAFELERDRLRSLLYRGMGPVAMRQGT